MIRFFDSHFPSRIIFLIILATAGMIGFQFYEVPLSENILRWMIVGEKLVSGKVLYRDVWVSEGPLYSWISVVVFGIFQRSYWSFSIFGMILVLIQAFYFAAILNRIKILKNRSYVPVLIYVLFFFFNRQLMGFSPVLLGMTFALIAMRSIVFYQFSDSDQGRPLTIGILLGLSMLASPVFIYYLPFYIVAMFSLSSMNIRNFLLWISGLLLPFALVFTYMFWKGATSEFLKFFVFQFFLFQNSEGGNFITALWNLALPLLLVLLGVLKSFGDSASTNFIEKVKRLFMWWFVITIVIFGISFQRINIHMGILMVVPFSYYFSQFISGWDRKVMAEIIFLLVIGVVVIANIYFKDKIYPKSEILDSRIVEMGNRLDSKTKIFTFKGRVGDYKHVRHGTAFLAPVLREKYLKWDSNREIVLFYQLFTVDQPEYVFDDEAGTFSSLLKRMPLLDREYNLLELGIYKRNSSETMSMANDKE